MTSIYAGSSGSRFQAAFLLKWCSTFFKLLSKYNLLFLKHCLMNLMYYLPYLVLFLIWFSFYNNKFIKSFMKIFFFLNYFLNIQKIKRKFRERNFLFKGEFLILHEGFSLKMFALFFENINVFSFFFWLKSGLGPLFCQGWF